MEFHLLDLKDEGANILPIGYSRVKAILTNKGWVGEGRNQGMRWGTRSTRHAAPFWLVFFFFFHYKCWYRASDWNEEGKKELGAREVDKGITRLEANVSGVRK